MDQNVPYTGVLPGKTTTTNCRARNEDFKYRNMGSTWSGPVAYLPEISKTYPLIVLGYVYTSNSVIFT